MEKIQFITEVFIENGFERKTLKKISKNLKKRVEQTKYRKIMFITPRNIKHSIERSSVTYQILEGYTKIFNI